MKILVVCKSDWGGSGYALAEAINAHGKAEAKHVVGRNWWTAYPSGKVNPSLEEFAELLSWADVWNIHDDADEMLNVNVAPKPIVVTYRGTWYRQNWKEINQKHLGKGYIQTCITQDLTRFGPDWVPRAVQDLSEQYKPADEFIVCHAPTKRWQKGTELVEAALAGLDGVKLDIIEYKPHVECMTRKAMARVCIDQVGPDAQGYGNNALEAWALGMPVISNASDDVCDRIKSSIGCLPFWRAQTVEEIREAVQALKADHKLWAEWRDLGRAVIKQWHNPKVVARRMLAACERAIAKPTGAAPKSTTVSVCMIVRNEERLLPAALDSTKALADEVVVCDTGSSDKTVEIASTFGAKVVLGGDPMHKGASRNLALDAATKDWVVVLDADEVIQDPHGLRHFLSKTDAGAIFIREMYYKGDAPQMSFPQQRAWPRGAFRYAYRAHEVPEATGEWPKEAFTDFVFEHRPENEKAEWKLQYTLDRLLLDQKERPNDPRTQYYLGRQYRYLQRWSACVETLERFLVNPDAKNNWDRANACFDLSMAYDVADEQGMRRARLHQAALEQPQNRQRWIELAKAYYDQQRFVLAAAMIKAALEIPREQEEGYQFEKFYGPLPLVMLSLCYARQGRLEDALAWLNTAGAITPGDPDVEHYQKEVAKMLEAQNAERKS